MAQSQLTIRTLGLAMVALVLACVHAARGDRPSGIATISGGTSGRIGGANVASVKGDPWTYKPEKAPMSAQQIAIRQAQALKVVKSQRGHAVAPANTAAVCIVRRVSYTPDGHIVAEPIAAPQAAGIDACYAPQASRIGRASSPGVSPAATPGSGTASAPAPGASPAKPTELKRNAFALTSGLTAK